VRHQVVVYQTDEPPRPIIIDTVCGLFVSRSATASANSLTAFRRRKGWRGNGILPCYVVGGPGNPLGRRGALYRGNTNHRIHDPKTIGTRVCHELCPFYYIGKRVCHERCPVIMRMRPLGEWDIINLDERLSVGTR
jgi:hypothetical protein